MTTDPELQARIDAMCSNDRIFAYVLLAAAWIAIWFVVVQIADIAPPGAFPALVYVSALAICVFNTASIVAMVRHYQEDKNHIYGQDIAHLDANARHSGSRTHGDCHAPKKTLPAARTKRCRPAF